jgi:hypothetical protein
MSNRIIRAAKDIGDVKGDKDRQKKMSAIIKMAEGILKSAGMSALPGIADACGEVVKLGDLVVKINDMSRMLKIAGPGTSESVGAQKALDRARGQMDVMIPALQATLGALEKIASASSKANEDVVSLKKALEEAERYAGSEKTRLAAAVQAVKNSATWAA